MPENNFEKKISSEMEGLKFKPSEQVWPKVEERIRKKKKRRVFIIFFLLSGLALLGWWQRNYFFGEKKRELVKIEKQKEESPTIPGKMNNSSMPQPGTELTKKTEITNEPDKTNEKQTRKELNIDKESKAVASVNKTYQPKQKAEIKSDLAKSKTNNAPQLSANIKPVQPEKQGIVSVNITKNDEAKEKADTEILKKEAKESEIKSVENQRDSIKTDAGEQENRVAEKKDTALKADIKTDSTAVKVQKKSNPQKWKWNVQITPGISSLHENIFSLGTFKSDYAYANPSTGSGSGGAISPAAPSDSKAGFALQAGVFAQKKITRHSHLLIGLQYGYYSEKIRIGSRKDTVSNRLILADANFYYRAANPGQEHINRYHFIEPTFQYKLQLNKNKARPFSWHTGFTIGRLIKTNAVMYDTAFGGSYYQNKKLVNKTQFSLSTGFSVTLLNTSKIQWNFGPQVDIHLNQLGNNPLDRNKYLLFTGVRTAIIFPGKK